MTTFTFTFLSPLQSGWVDCVESAKLARQLPAQIYQCITTRYMSSVLGFLLGEN